MLDFCFMANPEQRALLVHGYCDDWPTDEPHRPDRFSQLQIQAAVELVKQKKIAVVVFALGAKTAAGEVVAQLMAEELKQQTPEVKIVMPSPPTATTTRGEVRDFFRLDKEEQLDDLPLAALCINPHAPRVQRAIRRLGHGREVPLLTSETVLQETSPEMVKDLVAQKQYRGMVLRERLVLNPIDAIPFIGGPLLELVDRVMPQGKKLEAGAVTLLGKFKS